MTKRINRIYLIIAVFFLVISILIPILDFYTTKISIMDKGSFTTAEEYRKGIDVIYQAINGVDGIYDNFYVYFASTYEAIDQNSVILNAVELLRHGPFNHIITWYEAREEGYEVMFLYYILDKVLWVFVAYCIFIIPISMVDLFSKAIAKGVK